MGAEPRHFIRVQALVTGEDSLDSEIFTNGFQSHHITEMIDAANVFFDDAGIELVLDPKRNIAKVHSSILNNVDNGQARLARSKRHLTKLVIFFSDVQGGFSSGEDGTFISMPKAPDASGTFLAHELGHYFHLNHTFLEPEVANIDEAAQQIKQFVESSAKLPSNVSPFFKFDQNVINNGLSVFDADASTVSDTPPDLGAKIYLTFKTACHPMKDLLMRAIPVSFSSGQAMLYSFNPNRLNLMSDFFACPLAGKGFSPQQNLRMRNALENLNRRHLTMVQDNWRYCKKCHGLFFGGIPKNATCAMTGAHDPEGSFNYTLIHNSDEGRGQNNWRFCQKCLGLFFAGNNTNGKCPTFGPHDPSNSGDYTLLANSDVLGQNDWRWCSVCQSLFFGPKVAKTKCPIFNGKPHKLDTSGNYTLIAN